MKKTVRLGTLNLPIEHFVDVKNGKPTSGKVNDAGKAARKSLREYFAKTFGLDIVTKFAATANDNDGENPAFMIFGRNLTPENKGIACSLFSSDLKISHKNENFVTTTANKDGEISLKFADINDAVLDALKEYRDKAKAVTAKATASEKKSSKKSTKKPAAKAAKS